MPNISSKPIQLPEELGMFVDALRKQYSSIDEVWLLGPRVNEDEGKRGSEWDLLAFGDPEALSAIRAEPSLHREDLNLMIVTDGDRFERAWGPPESGRLSDLEWRLVDLHTATYVSADSQRETAVRVR